MKNIFTQCFSIEEADHLGSFLMSRGYEGVQNDSYRYCKLSIERALIDNEKHNRVYIYVGVNGCQMVVGRNKKQMRHKGSYKFIEKKRVFEKLLERY
ncbi:hypothetical protein [Bacteroides sp.]|uniref:hypothetical protein n=1 Tax=Bacteroides sp. TaxID=29523 RepID=UPI00262693FC|nr:hypothetical protein [Bacteroides sp.]MDD3038837.1 hypothetical protein [Bacteroides sp.]